MHRKDNKGSAVFYVFLAIVLFAALGFAISKSGRAPAIDYSEQEAEIEFQDFISYANTLEQAVQGLLAQGVTVAQLDFTAPGAGGFSTGPYNKKIFHPQGGGVEYRTQTVGGYAPYAYNKGSALAHLGTPLANGGAEVMFVAQVTLDMCRKLNKRLYGSNAIPAVATGSLTTFLAPGAVEINNAGLYGKKHICTTDLNGGQPAVENWQMNQPQTYFAGVNLGLLPRPDLLDASNIQKIFATAGNEIYVYLHILAIQ